MHILKAILFSSTAIGLLKVSFLLAVYAPAVLLAIQPQTFGFSDSFRPTFPKITVVKGHPHGLTCCFADRLHHFVFLKFTIKQGRGEIVELATLSDQGGGSQALMIAVVATARLPVYDILDETLQIIALLVDNSQIDTVGIEF